MFASLMAVGSGVFGVEIYKLQGLDEHGDHGTFTLTARREFSFWQQKNLLRYKLELNHGQQMQGYDQEVRVSIQWRSKNEDFERRAIFYGRQEKTKFLEIRLDNTYNRNITERRIYWNDNGYATSFPKSDQTLYEELVESG